MFVQDGPWASLVDSSGYLWLEEYPYPGGASGERVFNGHVFSLYGLYEYWVSTGNEVAAALVDGAATTARHYLPNPIRNVQFDCRAPHTRYHQIHTDQMMKLYEITWASEFASRASLLRADYPNPGVNNTVRVAAGTRTGYRFDADGRTLEPKTLKLTAATSAHADQRIRVRYRGIYHRITNGAWAGYMIAEIPGAQELMGKTVEQTYNPQRVLTFKVGLYTGYTLDASGRLAKPVKVSLSRPTSGKLGSTAWINGLMCYRPTSGPLAGHWVPQAAGLAFA